jgi:hypothetical protein
MAMRLEDTAVLGELEEGRHRGVGLRGADLREGRGELHIGACRDLDSSVPRPKERAGLGSLGS